MSRVDFTPRPYQQVIVDHIIDVPRCAVWAGMGLGKTVATLTALDLIDISEPGPALVIAPLRVAQITWPDEAAKWEHLKHLVVSPIVGSPAQRAAALKVDAQVYTTNYESLPWLVETLGGDWPFTKVVADESTKLKGFRSRQGTQRAKALAGVAHTRATRFIELTGTPSPNGLQDLWGQAWFLDKGERLGRSFQAFSDRWFTPTYDGFGITPRPGARQEIEARLGDLCLSLDARDWFDIGEPVTNVIRVELPRKARAMYEAMEREMFLELAKDVEVEAFNAASKTIKCLQLASGAIYTDDAGTWSEVHDAKLQVLDEIVEEASGMPVLVAYHFKSDLQRLMRAFPKGRALDADPQTIADWNAGKIPVLFAHPASAGHGLNLQHGGNILVMFSHWWNLEEYQQIVERIGPTRQAQAGLDRPVFIHHIVAADTVDELVMKRRQSKRELQDLLLEAMRKKR